MGTTKSAVLRMEAATKHAPSIATLKRYASAAGCELQVRLVPQKAAWRPRQGVAEKSGGIARCAFPAGGTNARTPAARPGGSQPRHGPCPAQRHEGAAPEPRVVCGGLPWVGCPPQTGSPWQGDCGPRPSRAWPAPAATL